MKIVCPSCAAVYNVPDSFLPKIKEMGELECSKCGVKWTPAFNKPAPSAPRPPQQKSFQRPPQNLNDLPDISPLDDEVSVDWGGEDNSRGKPPPRRPSQPPTSAPPRRPPPPPLSSEQEKKKRFAVRRTPKPGADVKKPPMPPRSAPPRTEKPTKSFSFGEKRPSAQTQQGGFGDQERIPTGKAESTSRKDRYIAAINNALAPILGKIMSKEKFMALIKKEQFWTWAWMGSFVVLVALFFLAYFNWESILHHWPPAGRIYHPD